MRADKSVLQQSSFEPESSRFEVTQSNLKKNECILGLHRPNAKMASRLIFFC